MKMADVRNKAKDMGIKPGKMRKADLIHNIQRKEGNQECYKSADAANCPEMECCWRDDCF